MGSHVATFDCSIVACLIHIVGRQQMGAFFGAASANSGKDGDSSWRFWERRGFRDAFRFGFHAFQFLNPVTFANCPHTPLQNARADTMVSRIMPPTLCPTC